MQHWRTLRNCIIRFIYFESHIGILEVEQSWHEKTAHLKLRRYLVSRLKHAEAQRTATRQNTVSLCLKELPELYFMLDSSQEM